MAGNDKWDNTTLNFLIVLLLRLAPVNLKMKLDDPWIWMMCDVMKKTTYFLLGWFCRIAKQIIRPNFRPNIRNAFNSGSVLVETCFYGCCLFKIKAWKSDQQPPNKSCPHFYPPKILDASHSWCSFLKIWDVNCENMRWKL